MSALPSQSSSAWPAPDARAGTATDTIISVIRTTGTLTAKITRQETVSTRKPPATGPTTAAIPDHAVHEPIAPPRSSGGNAATIYRQHTGGQQRAERALQRTTSDGTRCWARSRTAARRPRSPQPRSRTRAARRTRLRASPRPESANRAPAGRRSTPTAAPRAHPRDPRGSPAARRLPRSRPDPLRTSP